MANLLSVKPLVPIFYACDEKFLKYTMVSIRSIYENASKLYRYRVHILHMGISKEAQKCASEINDKNFDIEFVDVSDYMKQIESKLPIRDYYSSTTYFRLFISEIFPQYRKVIYIDSDTIILDDIAQMYEIKLGSNYAGVCPDRVVAQTDILGDYVESVLGINRRNYFNAGVMLINCVQFKRKQVLNTFLKMLNNFSFAVGQDQDYLNIICKDHLTYMDPKWNVQVFKQLPVPVGQAGLLHYNMAAKPWHYRDAPLGEYFWKYATLTSNYDVIYEELKNYPEEKKIIDNISGEKLVQMAISEIHNDDNYYKHMIKNGGKSEERLAILKKIEIMEHEGRFSEDAEENPPAPVLMPEDIEYLSKGSSARLQSKFSLQLGNWFAKLLMYKKAMIIKDYEGLKYIKSLKYKGAVVTCNHFNAFDSLAVTLAFQKGIGRFRRKNLYRVIREGNYTGFPGFYGYLMRHCYTLPLSSNFETMKKFMTAVDKLLQNKQFLLVYPEQGMWWNYRKPRPLQKGAFSFAAKNGKPILPIFITMKDSDILGDDGFPVQEYTVHVCKPIYPDSKLKYAENVKMLKDKNYEAWKKVYEDTYGIPLTYDCDEEILKKSLN